MLAGSLYARACVEGSAGNVFLAGSFTGALDLGGPSPLMVWGVGDTDVFVAKLSNTGIFQWNKAYRKSAPPSALPSTQQATAIALTPQAAPVVVGVTENPIDFGLGTLTPAGTSGVQDAFVIELSP
jgi:hypothetical protein